MAKNNRLKGLLVLHRDRTDAGTKTDPGRPSPGAGEPTTGKELPWRSRRWWITFLSVLAANYVLLSLMFPARTQRVEIPYTVFKQQVQAGNVAEVMSRSDIIQGSFRQPVQYPANGDPGFVTSQFSTVRPAFADPGLERLLDDQAVVINARSIDEPRSWWQTLLFSFGPTLLLLGAFLWLSKRMGAGGGLFGMGRSRAKRYDQAASGEPRVTFADVAGIDEAEQELAEVVDFLRNPEKYTRLGGVAPKGVLLVGAPGGGKTLLARAVAGEAGVSFFSISASEFVEMIVGVGASRVRDLFKQARESAPAIIFIDELDAIGRARGRMAAVSGHNEQEQTLNQILTEMDGFSSREGVIVLGATNRPDVLDPALLRPGRFDRQVFVPPPDKAGRAAILAVHIRDVILADDVDLTQIAAATPGLVGADLRNLVNEAALLAARRNEESVHHRDFLDALEKLTLGPARHLLLSREERERVAYHEGGHAILGLVTAGADPVNRVTIMPRGQALGVTYQRPEDDRYNYGEAYLRGRIAGTLGGRAAELVVYGTRTTGCDNDLQQATALARQMVTRWGMSDRIGPVALAPRDGGFLDAASTFGPGNPRPFSEATAQLIDAEVRRILDECSDEAVRLLSLYRHELDTLAAALLERETLDEVEILTVTGLPRAPRLESPRIIAGNGTANGNGAIGPNPVAERA